MPFGRPFGLAIRTISTTSFVVLMLVSTARSQTPQNLPVIFESDDARDFLYEAATDALAQLHFAKNVPLSQLTVPCGNGSSLSPYHCNNGTFHDRYKDWIAQHPGLIEIDLHGLTHSEYFSTYLRNDQLDLMNKALQEMATWGLPQGRPWAFAPPFSSEDANTISILQQLGFHTSIRNSDTCLGSSTMDVFCESISLCQRDNKGNRVAGPSCVLLSPSDLINQVNGRQSDGKVFVVYHVQDVLLSDLTTVDQAKMDNMAAILDAFRSEELAGHYQLMTYGERFAGDILFGDGFESGNLSAWSSSVTDGGDLSVTNAAAEPPSTLGLQAIVNDTNALYVESDLPNSENRYHARFYVDPNGFDPGEASGHGRVRLLIAFDSLSQRLVTIVLRRVSGAYSVGGRVRLNDGTRFDTGFFPITDAAHAIEFDWKRASSPGANDGSFQLWIDGTSMAAQTGLANGTAAVDFVRMGAIGVKDGAAGTLYFDDFESRRASVGP